MVLNQIMQGGRHFKYVLVDEVECTSHPLTELVHGRTEVTCLIQLFFQPAVVELVCIRGQFFDKEIFAFHYPCHRQITAFFYTGRNRFKYSFTAEHAGFHCSVRALDLAKVQEAGIITNQRTTRQGESW